MINIQNTLAST